MDIASFTLYFTLFISLFFEVFLLITYFEAKQDLKREKIAENIGPSRLPSVSIIVPCYNEERTVGKTLNSIFDLDYPKELLKVIAIDDGSTDSTLNTLKSYSKYSNFQYFSKPNGGKHTALNFALEKIDTELVGCLDADSFVSPEALKRIIVHFEDPEVMSVTPSIRIHEPKTFFQYIQRVEYIWGIFLRRMLSSINALYVTPGPFSIFRRSVFKEIGGYKHGHYTEDMEMAMRLHKAGYKIANSTNAYVYTVGPAKFKHLYKQRVRWTYGFLNNVIDYKEMLFNPRYGNIGLFILPIATFSVFSTIYASTNLVWSLLGRIPSHVAKWQAVGFEFHMPFAKFSWFAMDTSMLTWIIFTTVFLSLVILSLSLKLVEGKPRFGKDVALYLVLYIFIVPLWLAKAAYSTVMRRDISWK